MKRKGLMVLCCLFVTLSVQGCQKNPEKDIVVNKNEGLMEEAIKKEKTNEEENIPETYKDSFDTKSGDVKISVYAAVEKIDKKLPVVRVKPHEITEEEVKRFADVLFEGKTAYEPASLTKAQIEEKILSLKEKVSDEEFFLGAGQSEEEAEKLKELYNNMIDSYEESYENAPETQEKRECDWKFHPGDYYAETSADTDENLNKTWEIQAVTDDLNGYRAMIHAANRNEDDFKLHMLWFYYEDIPDPDMRKGTLFSGKKISEKEAVSMGDELLEKLDLKEWKLWDVSKSPITETDESYSLYYTPAYNGVQSLLGPEDIDVKSEDIYASNLYYSVIIVRIENGVITSVEITSPMDTVNYENENVDTLSFEDVYANFKSQMQTKINKNTYASLTGEEEAGSQTELVVTDIRQALFRVKEKNNEEEYLMIPVWQFSGNVLANGEVIGKNVEFLTINGLDGSMINMDLGY